jgi:hypothetical protein
MPTPNGHARPPVLGKERTDEFEGEGEAEGGVGSCLCVSMGVGRLEAEGEEEWWRARPTTVLVGEPVWDTCA